MIYSEEYKILINKLKAARLKISLDQKDVAKKLSKSQSYVSKLEAGQIRIDVLILKKLAKIYGKPVEFFIGNTK